MIDNYIQMDVVLDVVSVAHVFCPWNYIHLDVQEVNMAKRSAFEEIEARAGIPLRLYLYQRLNEPGMTQKKLAREFGMSERNLYNKCQELGVLKRHEYYLAETEAELDRVAI